MKQTAVKWYCNEMETLRVNAEINNMDAHKFLIRKAEIFEQAKEMEKQQIIDCYEYIKYNLFAVDSGEQYYNETFKSE